LAGREIENRRYETASAIAGSLLKNQLTPPAKLAVWKVKILAAGENQNRELVAALKSRDESARRAALTLFPELVKSSEVEAYLPLLARLSDNLQVQVAAVLSKYPVLAVREYLMNLVEKGTSAEVRTEALHSLGKTGDSSNVEFLAMKAASARGKEKAAARESLAQMAGRMVDEKIWNFWRILRAARLQ